MSTMSSTDGVSTSPRSPELAAQLRVDSIRTLHERRLRPPHLQHLRRGPAGHADGRHLRYDWDTPEAPGNDHLVFSKGHASPLLYAVYKAAGVVSDQELMNGYRRFDERLEGHPTPVLPWVDVATGSLGQGLPDAVGIALSGKYLEKAPYRVWVLCGDSEMAEGSMWEALRQGLPLRADEPGHDRRRQSAGPARPDRPRLGPGVLPAPRRGVRRPCRRHRRARHRTDRSTRWPSADGDLDKPLVILAKTIKGKGFSEVEDADGWHGKPLPEDKAEEAIAELGGERNLLVRGPMPPTDRSAPDPGGHREHADLREGRGGRDPQGLRRRARRPRRRRSPRGRPGRRGLQLHRDAAPSSTSIRSASSRCSSRSSRWWPPPPGSPLAATSPSPPPSPRSSPAQRTSSAWRPSPASTCGWSAPMRASRSGPTVPPRWAWRISRCSPPRRAPPCSTPPTAPPPQPSCSRWPRRPG